MPAQIECDVSIYNLGLSGRIINCFTEAELETDRADEQGNIIFVPYSLDTVGLVLSIPKLKKSGYANGYYLRGMSYRSVETLIRTLQEKGFDKLCPRGHWVHTRLKDANPKSKARI